MTSISTAPLKTDLNMPMIQEEPEDHNASQSEDRTARIRVKNRRKMYLDRNPSYFTSPDLELSGASFAQALEKVS